MKKYFIPNEENEYKPHIFRNASVAVISFVAIFVFFVGTVNVTLIRKTNLLSAVISQTLVDLANGDRVQNQIGGLMVSPVLTSVAQAKANDMASKGYFAHTSPEGKTPWYWFDVAGYNFQYAGENLAVNFSDSSDVNTAWMGSPGHRANILNGKFTEIGVATAKGVFQGRDTIFVVQVFGKPLPVLSQIKNALDKTTATPVNKITDVTTKNAKATTTQNATTTTILGESESFVETGNTNVPLALTDQKQNVLQKSQTATLVDSLVTSPKKTISALYIALGGFVILSLILMIFIEIKRQHPKLIALGVGLLVLIIVLAYVYRSVLIGQVLVI